MIKKIITTLALCLAASACSAGAQTAANAPLAPQFTGINHWINSEPLDITKLQGKVVLVEFWTYSCINCIHTMPYVKQWHRDYKDQGLVVVGVHTPEYGYEKIQRNVENAVKRFDIEYPVAQDNGYQTWNAWGNRYWPALYLVDKQGHVVYQHFGEGDYQQTEAKIRQLLAQQ